MNTATSIGPKSPLFLRWLAGCLVVGSSVLSGKGDDAVLDFRNFIAGVLDAPVYRAEGTNRLSGATGCSAQIYVGVDKNALSAVGAPLPFWTSEWAGYVTGEGPVPVVVPFAQAGDRVWVQMRAWEPSQDLHVPEVSPPRRFTGESEVFSLVVSNTPTPLIGLKSFRLQPAPITASQQGGQLILRWSAGDGTVDYELQEVSALDTQDAWRPSSLRPVLEVQNSEWTWVADWVVTSTLTGPAAFYRIRLLSP